MPTALTIGTFDGVHIGHGQLVRTARSVVGDDGAVVVLAFDPPPFRVLRPDAPQRALSTFAQRTRWLRAAGADEVLRLEPTAALLRLSPEDFVAWLVDRHRPAAIVEGPDFRFGAGRAGCVRTLRRLQSAGGYRTVVIDPVQTHLSSHHLVRASSTLARWLVAHGRVRDAGIVLGRPFELECAVVRGDQRGRDLGAPTVNLDARGRVLPADGVYAGDATVPGGAVHPAAISVGTKPTFGERTRVCEAHLIGYAGDGELYGATVRLRVREWLRDQITYAKVADLVAQIHGDIEQTQRIWSDAGRRDLIRG